MDPEALNHVDWRHTSYILRWMWFVLIFVFFFAAHLTLAHGIIPSLLDSGHVPNGLRERVRKMRFPLYIVSLLLLCGAGIMIAVFITSTREIFDFWPGKLI